MSLIIDWCLDGRTERVRFKRGRVAAKLCADAIYRTLSGRTDELPKFDQCTSWTSPDRSRWVTLFIADI